MSTKSQLDAFISRHGHNGDRARDGTRQPQTQKIRPRRVERRCRSDSEYSMVVFDMAGTTVDEKNIVYKCVRKALINGGYTVDLDTVLLNGAGKEKLEAIKDTIRAITGQAAPEAKSREIFDDFKTILERAYREEPIAPMPGCEELFRELKSRGIRVVLDTGYDRKTAEHLLRRLGWVVGRDVDFLITASDVREGRPAPEMIRKAMREFGLTDPSRVMKVGDSRIDIEEGLNAQCGHSVGITTGAQPAEELYKANPTAVIDSLREVLELIGEGQKTRGGCVSPRVMELEAFLTANGHRGGARAPVGDSTRASLRDEDQYERKSTVRLLEIESFLAKNGHNDFGVVGSLLSPSPKCSSSSRCQRLGELMSFLRNNNHTASCPY